MNRPPLSPKSFVRSLKRIATKRSLTAGDLAIWFGRPRATVYSWLFSGHLPMHGPVLVECCRRLDLLYAVKTFPVPYEVTKFARRQYILEAYKNAGHAGVSEGPPAGHGPQVRDGHQE